MRILHLILFAVSKQNIRNEKLRNLTLMFHDEQGPKVTLAEQLEYVCLC